MESLSNIVSSQCSGGITAQLLTSVIASLSQTRCSLKPKYPDNIGNNHLDVYDFIVVGSGSAGSPLTAKLTNNPNWTVLLIEAGYDPPTDSDVPYWFFALEGLPELDWGYKTVPQKNACLGLKNQQSSWTRAKMLGGCSSTNGMIYQEGNHKDYDDWERLGNRGWNYSNIKKYFETFRNKVAFQEGLPELEIIKIMENDFKLAARELGFDIIDDIALKSNGTIGYFDTLLSIKNGTRNNAARIFLEPIRDRPNFHLLKKAQVIKVLVDKTTKEAIGVEVLLDGQREKIYAKKEVILSAGAINSPKLLILSGVGRKNDLKKLKIPVISNLPVGQNLIDHPIIIYFQTFDADINDSILNLQQEMLTYLLNKTGSFSKNGHLFNLLGYMNTKNDSQYPDIEFHHKIAPKGNFILKSYLEVTNFNDEIINTVLGASVNKNILITFATLLKPKSIGSLHLKNADPFEAPILDPNYAAHEDDFVRNVNALKHIDIIAKTKSLKKYNITPVPFKFQDCEELESEDRFHKCYVKYVSSTIYHPVGTAKMSSGLDGVVDEKLRVKGVKDLRVADASIMPTIVSGNINAPCMMIGSHLGDIILRDYGSAYLN